MQHALDDTINTISVTILHIMQANHMLYMKIPAMAHPLLQWQQQS